MFFQNGQNTAFLLLYYSAFKKKLQQWSLYEVIEEILPFVLNTKRPLSDIWLLTYKQKLTGVPKNRGAQPFPDPVGHFGAPGQPFWIFAVLEDGMIESKTYFVQVVQGVQ